MLYTAIVDLFRHPKPTKTEKNKKKMKQVKVIHMLIIDATTMCSLLVLL